MTKGESQFINRSSRGFEWWRCAAAWLAIASLLAPHGAIAQNSRGGVVAAGAGTIVESAGRTDVYQHTDKAVFDWRNHDVATGEVFQYHQPGSNSWALSRVLSSDATVINGDLLANGNLMLVNQNGIFFGQNARVDVNGLVASTSDILNSDFMAGEFNLTIPGMADAQIVNEGLITAGEAGLVGLVSPYVENHGIIRAKLGNVQLASADTARIDFYGDGLLSFEFDASDALTSQLIHNTGVIDAEGGTIELTAAAGADIVNSLIVVEGELNAPTFETYEGAIRVVAEGSNKTGKTGNSTVYVDGTLNASGRDTGERGGNIDVLADRIALLDDALLDASGSNAVANQADWQAASGTATMTADDEVRSEAAFLADDRRAGGSIKVGGDYLGLGDTQTAKLLYVDEGAVTLNNALESGDAGRSIFWSDDTTDFRGLVLGLGGTQYGNGGFLETSGKVQLNASGFADLSARASEGVKGTYLLDPANVTIYGNVDPTFTSTDGSVDLAGDNVLWFDGTDSGSFVTGATLLGNFAPTNNLGNGDVARNQRAFFRADITIPANPVGTIYEQGATGFGAWVGFLANGDMVFHAGRGNSFAANDAAHILIPAASAPTGTGRLEWDIDPANNSITAFWNGTQIGTDTATNFNDWAGTDPGGFGNSSGNVVNGAVTTAFNGTLNSNLSYFPSDPATATTSINAINDKSPGNNDGTPDNGAILQAVGAINGNDAILINDGVEIDVGNTNDINDGNRDQFGKSFTFRTDGDVNVRQVLYKEGGGTNGYAVYIEGSQLYVGTYNDNGGDRVWRQFSVDANTNYHLTSIFDATTDTFTASLNGVVSTGAALGVNDPFNSHTGAISFGRTDGSFRDANGNNISESRTVSLLGEAIFHDERSISDVERQLLEQYSSAKWNIGLLDNNAVNEVAAATDENTGFSAFASSYLERLSQTADVVIQADNTITLDLQGDTLSLADDRSLTLRTTNGAISDVSAGVIETNRTSDGGNITLSAGGAGDITLNTTTLRAQNGGVVNAVAGGDVTITQAETLRTGVVSGDTVSLTTTGGDIINQGAVYARTGTVTMNAANDLNASQAALFTRNQAMDLDAGGDIALSNQIDTGNGTLTADAGGDITISDLPPITSGLITQLGINETSGSTTADAVGSNDGALTADATFDSDSPFNQGTSLTFDGNGDRVNLGDVDAIEETETTISFWAKVDSLTRDGGFVYKGGHAVSQPILIWRDDNASGGGYVGNGNLDTISVIVTSGGTEYRFAAPEGSWNDTEWKHVALTLDPANNHVELYLDGLAQIRTDNVLNNNGIGSGSQNVTLARATSGGQPLRGNMDDVRFYDRALTAEEVAQLQAPVDGWNVGNAQLRAGNDVNVNGALDGTGTVRIEAARDVNLGADISTTSAAANALVVSAQRDLNNSAGADALSAVNSRWLAYTNSDADATLDGLTPDFSEFEKSLATDSPATIGAGNRVIYNNPQSVFGSGGTGVRANERLPNTVEFVSQNPRTSVRGAANNAASPDPIAGIPSAEREKDSLNTMINGRIVIENDLVETYQLDSNALY